MKRVNHYLMGRLAYRVGDKNPNTFGTPEYEEWLKGYHAERETIAIRKRRLSILNGRKK